MSLQEIFSAVGGFLSAIWHYPIPWDTLFAVAILVVAAVMVVFVTWLLWQYCKQIWAALVAFTRKRRSPS